MIWSCLAHPYFGSQATHASIYDVAVDLNLYLCRGNVCRSSYESEKPQISFEYDDEDMMNLPNLKVREFFLVQASN